MNICRTITFFNNFVPPSAQIQEWNYEALGYFDGINIGENIIGKKEFDLSQMWNALEIQAKTFKGKYTAQTIHIFRHEDTEEGITDKCFWGEYEKTYPFLFIVMLRLNKKSSMIQEIKSKLEKELYNDEIKVITYLSLDNNDLIVILRSREYIQGTNVIDKFHQHKMEEKERSLFYDSFSVCGISKTCLNDSEYHFFNEGCIIDKVCLRIIEKSPGSVKLIEEKLKSCLPNSLVHRYPVLGCEDEVILLENVSWGDFWKLYRDESGCLSNSDKKIYNKAVMGITTLVLQGRSEKESGKGIDLGISGDPFEKVENVCDEFREECLKFYNTLNEDYEEHERMYYKAILQIINSLQKYVRQKYADYTYITLYHPMKMLLSLIKEAKSKNCEGILDEISRFFYAINLLTQNSVRLERQFIQSVELNVRIYEAPVQLSIFYAAYFSLLRDILNQNSGIEHRYEFMICPGMIEHLNVRKLFPKASRTKSLLLVEIPENQMFNIKNQLVRMVHEAAHFVGSDIRQRPQRYNFMLRAITKSVATFLILDKDMHQYCRRESINQFESMYFIELERETELYEHKIRELSKGDREPDEKYYAEYMREDLRICAQNALLGNMELLEQIGAKAFYREFSPYKMKNKDPKEKIQRQKDFKMDFQENKTSFLIKMLLPSNTLSDERCIENIVDSNIHLFKESFADLMSVLLLELTEKEYIEIILPITKKIDMKKTFNTAMWRISLVIKTMCSMEEEGCNWSIDVFREIAQQEEKTDEDEPLKKVLELVEEYLSGKDIFDLYEKKSNIRDGYWNLDRLYNFEVGMLFVDYLSSCRRWLINSRKRERDKNKNLKKLREIYRELSKVDDVEKYILYLRGIIEDYKKFVEEKMGK